MDQLPFRQIHLDFHTSEKIAGIGKDWDKLHFQRMLKLGHVSSITLFSKCHHGWSYHPTSVPMGAIFPGLEFNLLGAQLEAVKEIGVQAPVYISVGLDEKLVLDHTDWLVVNPDGSRTWSHWLQAGYHLFCLNTPYLDYVIAQAEEVARRYECEGLFFDIVGIRDCCCQYCTKALLARGKDPRDAEARKELGREVYLNYARRINEAVHAVNPKLRIFHNGGHISRGDRELASLNTHLELESLPTGGWGYDHFPLSARYVQGLGFEVLGMTGKFHTTWGEFGGYKHPNALRYEASLSIANGAKVSIGDQMHPYGKLDEATYALIGEAFAEVEAKEEWCSDVTGVADIGVLSLEAAYGGSRSGHSSSPAGLVDAGVIRMLQESKYLYDVIDMEYDFSKYKVIILPDAVPPTLELIDKLQAYLQGGGRIFATGASLLDEAEGKFAVDMGIEYTGKSVYNPEYIKPRFELAHWKNASFVVYAPGILIKATGGEVLADRQEPFFNRDLLHFSSHQHAPNTMENAGPAIVATANTVYAAFPVFKLYGEKGQNALREIVMTALSHLLPSPTLATNLPAQGIQTVMRQTDKGRTIVHLLYASPVKRGSVEVIEDLLPIRDTEVELRIADRPKRVYLAPQGTDLPFTFEGGAVRTTVPEFTCHQMVVVE